MNQLSISQIDKLGSRLKKQGLMPDDVCLLDAFRNDFGDAFRFVIDQITTNTEFKPVGRPSKSTNSIIEKLQRETIRLSQMQDIAGCRIVVDNITTQNEITNELCSIFPTATVVDRREKPSHGYRAVHLIVKHMGKLVEIQIRTRLQHLWAELSEALSDEIDPNLKYGLGKHHFQEYLNTLSNKTCLLENQFPEKNFENIQQPLVKLTNVLKEGKRNKD